MIRRAMITGLGMGYAPVAPGTFGSASAAAVALGLWALHQNTAAPIWTRDAVLVVLTILSVAGCVRWCPWAIEHFKTRAKTPKKAKDPGHVVLDEWAGQFIALVAIPMPNFERALLVLAVQFFLFRLFDITKPPPARQLENLPAGWGIALDDVAAGIYANIAGQLLLRMVF